VNLLVVLLSCLGAVVVLMAATALLARAIGRVVVVDVTWGLGFVLIALVAALTGTNDVRWWLFVMVGLWGGRLAWHVGRRVLATDEEDPRYAAMLEGKPFSFAVVRVFLVQGVAMWFVALPVQVAASTSTSTWSGLVWIGAALWALGLVFESVGDRQLAAYRAQPRDSRPQVMDQGLWRYTRHPNYFGDACVWWGVWLAGIGASGVVVATVLSPVVMSYFLVFATGAKLLEKTMMKRPGYPEYAARTSMFFPLPPRRESRNAL
jgi:steroid 5-alpha reductase family enzyme